MSWYVPNHAGFGSDANDRFVNHTSFIHSLINCSEPMALSLMQSPTTPSSIEMPGKQLKVYFEQSRMALSQIRQVLHYICRLALMKMPMVYQSTSVAEEQIFQKVLFIALYFMCSPQLVLEFVTQLCHCVLSF